MPDENTFEPPPQGALAQPPRQTFSDGFEPLPQGALAKPDRFQPLPSASADGFEPLPQGALRQPAPGLRDEQKTDANAPWYEKAWDWSNKPLVALHREGAGPIESGFEDIA